MFGDRDYSKETRSALTPAKKHKLMGAVGNKCEKCGETRSLHVHHISDVHKANGTTDKNTPSNIIVLDANCHGEAHSGKIKKATLKAIVSKRSKKKKEMISAILRDRPKAIDDKPTRAIKNIVNPRITKMDLDIGMPKIPKNLFK
jgi:hypothetical protein